MALMQVMKINIRAINNYLLMFLLVVTKVNFNGLCER